MPEYSTKTTTLLKFIAENTSQAEKSVSFFFIGIIYRLFILFGKIFRTRYSHRPTKKNRKFPS